MELDFEDMVAEALEGLPREFRKRLGPVEVLIQDEPTAAQLNAVGVPSGHTLLGLYHGVPLTQRRGMIPAFPDRVTIFRGPLLRQCRTEDEVRKQVRHTVLHELAHFFGISDDRLHELGAY